MAMKRHSGGVECQDSSDADKDDVGLGGMPVVGPLFNIHDCGIVLGHVALADTSNALLPRLGCSIQCSHPGRKRCKLWCGCASDTLLRGRLLRSKHGGRIKSAENGSHWNCCDTGPEAGFQEVAAIEHGFTPLVSLPAKLNREGEYMATKRNAPADYETKSAVLAARDKQLLFTDSS